MYDLLPSSKIRLSSLQEHALVSGSHCKRPPRLHYRWPLALDLFVEVFQADRAGNVLSFFVSIVERTGNTFEQLLLGTRGIGTRDPENIEAVLSTQFNGKYPRTSGVSSSDTSPVRFWTWRSVRSFSSTPRPRYIHSRWHPMAVLSRTVTASIYGDQIQVFCWYTRAD